MSELNRLIQELTSSISFILNIKLNIEKRLISATQKPTKTKKKSQTNITAAIIKFWKILTKRNIKPESLELGEAYVQQLTVIG